MVTESVEMKPFYNLGYNELFTTLSIGNKRLQRMFQLTIFWFIVGFFTVLFFINNADFVFLCLLFVICIVSMLPIRVVPWMGLTDLNIVLTVYATIQFGPHAGLFLANACLIGNLIFGEVDYMLFDIGAALLVVLVASFFPMAAFTTATVISLIVFDAAAIIFLVATGLFEFNNVMWLTTMSIGTLFIVLKLLPLITRMFA